MLNSLSSLHLWIKLLKKEKIIKNKRKEKRTKKFRDTIEFNSFFLSTYTYFFPNLQQNSEPKFIITSPEQADEKESVPGMVEIEKSLFILLSLSFSLFPFLFLRQKDADRNESRIQISADFRYWVESRWDRLMDYPRFFLLPLHYGD